MKLKTAPAKGQRYHKVWSPAGLHKALAGDISQAGSAPQVKQLVFGVTQKGEELS